MTITQDSSAPLVAIVGATGNQGGSVLRFLAESDRPYRLRALTRDASKPAAKKLAEQGAEVVSVTLSADNLEGAKRAFEGADIAFVRLASLSLCVSVERGSSSDEGRELISSTSRAHRASPTFGSTWTRSACVLSLSLTSSRMTRSPRDVDERLELAGDRRGQDARRRRRRRQGPALHLLVAAELRQGVERQLQERASLCVETSEKLSWLRMRAGAQAARAAR